MNLHLRILLPVLLAFPALAGGWQSHTPYHGALDAVAQAGEPVTLEAWFRHGAMVQKDLEHAKVRVEWQRGAAWEPLTERITDAKGHADHTVTAPEAGPVRVRWWFKDQAAEATLWIVPKEPVSKPPRAATTSGGRLRKEEPAGPCGSWVKGADAAERPPGDVPPGWGGGRHPAASGSNRVKALCSSRLSCGVPPGAPSAACGGFETGSKGQPAVIFDIDGTLTPSDSENLKDYARRLVRHPSEQGPKIRVGAVEAARAAAREGLVVYVTGRPPWLSRPTREWLAHHGFPEGAVFCMTQSRDILPSTSHVGRAKTARFRSLQAAGLHFLRAYGNALTDIQAYAAVGLPKDRTFILGKHGGEAGTVALGEGFPTP